MNCFFVQVSCMTIIGTIILLIRKIFGKSLYPQVSTLLWILFFISALLPITIIKDLQIFSNTISSSYTYTLQLPLQIEFTSTNTMESLLIERDISWQISHVCRTIWLIGATICMIYKIYIRFTLRKKLKNLNVLYDTKGVNKAILDDTYVTVSNYIKEYNMETNIIITRDVGPAVYGIKPSIYIPLAICENPQELKSIILHEFSHITRKHVYILWLSDILCALYWFLPYVYLGFIPALREDMEFQCDYDVIHTYGVKSKDYALHYVNTLQNKQLSLSELPFKKKVFQKRIDFILRKRYSTQASIIISIIAIVLLLSSFVSINLYYQLPNHNGHSNAEIEDAKEIIKKYALAHEREDAQQIQELRFVEYTLNSLIYNVQHSRYSLYFLSYDENANSYNKNRWWLEQQGIEYSNFIQINSIATLKNSSEIHEKISCDWILFRDNEKSPWQIYDISK